jgi:hypothetical protein
VPRGSELCILRHEFVSFLFVFLFPIMYFHLPGDARIYGRLRTYYTHAAYMPAWEMRGQPTTDTIS